MQSTFQTLTDFAMDKVAECMTAVDLTKADEKTLESIEFLIGAELKSRGSLQ